MQDGRVRKIAVLGKDYYTKRTIDDLFIFAGADPNWWELPATPSESERMTRVYGWVAGIQTHAPSRLDRILAGVAEQISDNDSVPEQDRKYLRRTYNVSSSPINSVGIQRGDDIELPGRVEQLLERLILGLPRATFPLKYRRKDLPTLEFDNEYDVQSLFHALLRPWIRDVRAEEYTPSYAGKSTRADFVLPDYGIVVEIKFVRSPQHAKSIGDELIVDVAHYRVHPTCAHLWAVIYDPNGYIQNPEGISAALDGRNEDERGKVQVRTLILSP